jgi:hypothetical protein
VKQRAYANETRTFNRRVEVEVTDTIVEERQDISSSSTSSAASASEKAEHGAAAAH